MGPKEIYDLLADVGALSLQHIELDGVFIQKEVVKGLVLPQITLERGSLGIQRVGPVRINPAVLGDKGSAEKLYSYVYTLAHRGYEVRVRYVSPLDLVPGVPLLSRVLRLILLGTGLWKKTLWVEVSAAPSR
jgi:hypothetical protein